MKVLGNIFEEMYGPLSHSDKVNGIIHPTCTVSELSSVDVVNGSKQVNSSPHLCELTTSTVTHSSAGMLQPPAEVSDSSIQLLSVSDSDTQPSVVNLPMPSMPSEFLTDVSCPPSDIARDWSTGVLVTDASGKSVEVMQ